MEQICDQVVRAVLDADSDAQSLPAVFEQRWRLRWAVLCAASAATAAEAEAGSTSTTTSLTRDPDLTSRALIDTLHCNPYLQQDEEVRQQQQQTRGGAVETAASDSADLCSDDDEDGCDEPDTSGTGSGSSTWRGDLIVGYFRQVRRQRHQWRFELVDCVALMGGREYAVAQLRLDARFS